MQGLTLALASLFTVTPLAGAKPNIVLVLADDMGYGDVRALNPKSGIPTPNLDRLAAGGMTFTDAHSPSAVCTPTRYATLTGRYCWRGRLKRGVLNGYSPPLIEDGRETIGSLLAAEGYHTACIGKWHLGLGFVREGGGQGEGKFGYTRALTDGPHTRGFAYSFVIPASLDFPPYVYIEDGTVTAPPDRVQPAAKFPGFLRRGPIGADFVMEDALDEIVGRAAAYLKARAADKEKPFFLYLPLTSPHKPVLPHARFRGKTKLGPYGDFVAQTDAAVGVVLDALEANGQDEDTLVIYTSDNGSFMFRQPGGGDHIDDETVQAYRPENHTANGVLRGTKADIWEGGHRVPFFARWPARVKPGSSCDHTITHTDIFATCAALAGAGLPEGAGEDSFSLLPLLAGEGAAFDRAPVINHSTNGTFAIRDGGWKLVLGNGSGGRQAPRGKPFGKPYQLYDLSADLGETEDLAGTYPDVVERLARRCEALRQAGRSRS